MISEINATDTRNQYKNRIIGYGWAVDSVVASSLWRATHKLYNINFSLCTAYKLFFLIKRNSPSFERGAIFTRKTLIIVKMKASIFCGVN